MSSSAGAWAAFRSGFRFLGSWHESGVAGRERVRERKRRAFRLAARGFAELGDQWWQAPGLPAESAVLKLLPQPQADTALGLLTVKPAPISVSR